MRQLSTSRPRGRAVPSSARGRWVVDGTTAPAPDRAGRGSWMLVVVLGILMVACLGKLATDASGPASARAQATGGPINSPDSVVGADEADVCSGDTVAIIGTGLCTHGFDPVPDGARELVGGAGAAPPIDCVGDGSSGYRVQVLYVRPSNVSSQASGVRPFLRTVAQAANQIYRDSAAETGGYRSIRFVHDASCRILIDEVTISSTADDYFNTTITALQSQGFDDVDRMYMIFMDTTVFVDPSGEPRPICGIGTYWQDDRDSSSNLNNSGAAYGRVDPSCWGYPDVAAHELMHNLGAVQASAPHATLRGHCTDEYEVMCYPDDPNRPGYPRMTEVCSPEFPRDYSLFDCRNDDYFHTNPSSGSYLGRHWNAADNRFLIGAGTTGPRPGTLTLSKDKSKYNGLVEATVSGLAPNAAVTLRWPRAFEITSGPNRGQFTTGLDTATTDAQGRASFGFPTPLEPYGDYEVTARDPSGGRAVATLRVIPRILLNETEGPTDTNLRVYFYGFAPSERIEVRWHANGNATSSFRVLKTITVASNGRASSLVTIPSDTGVGDRLVVGKVVGVSRSASTTFEVTAGGGSVDDATATTTRTATPRVTPTVTSEPDVTETPVSTEEPAATETPTAATEPVPTETQAPTEEPTATPVPNASPIASAGDDRSVADADGSGGEPVALDASGSTDPEGGAPTYSWTIDGVEVATGVNPTVVLPVGSSKVLLTVTDDEGAMATDEVIVVVVEPAPVDEG